MQIKHSLYLQTLLLMMTLFISSCSHHKPPKGEFETDHQDTHLMQKNWALSYVDDPILQSKVAVLTAGDKQNPPIILIHGLGEIGMKSWFSVIPELEKNYFVIALDLPGFGRSVPAQGRFLPTNYAHVVKAVTQQFDIKKATVIGHSLGGAIALRYTALFEDAVDHLILIDAAGLLEKSAFIKHIAHIEFGENNPSFVQQQIKELNKFSDSVIEASIKSTWMTDFLQNNDAAWRLIVEDSSNINAALSLVEEDFSEAVDKITVPVDIIWGQRDNIAPLRTAKVLNKQIRFARLQVIKEAGHVPMNSHPFEFHKALLIALYQPIKDEKLPESVQINQGVLHCKGQDNRHYSGYYEQIILNDCGNILLTDIATSYLSITNSVVDIENLTFSAFESFTEMQVEKKITIDESIVTITNANITGKSPLLISASRVDMAGVSLIATDSAIKINDGSRISVSLSDITSPHYTGIIHGAYYLKDQDFFD